MTINSPSGADHADGWVARALWLRDPASPNANVGAGFARKPPGSVCSRGEEPAARKCCCPEKAPDAGAPGS